MRCLYCLCLCLCLYHLYGEIGDDTSMEISWQQLLLLTFFPAQTRVKVPNMLAGRNLTQHPRYQTLISRKKAMIKNQSCEVLNHSMWKIMGRYFFLTSFALCFQFELMGYEVFRIKEIKEDRGTERNVWKETQR